MPTDNFDNHLKEKLQNIEIKPNDNIWNNIEKEIEHTDKETDKEPLLPLN